MVKLLALSLLATAIVCNSNLTTQPETQSKPSFEFPSFNINFDTLGTRTQAQTATNDAR